MLFMVGVQQVRDGGRAFIEVKGAYSFPDLAVCYGGSLVLAEVLRPGLDYESLQVTTRRRDVLEESPAHGAVPPAYATELEHGYGELWGAPRIYPILDRNQHGPALHVRLVRYHWPGSRRGCEVEPFAQAHLETSRHRKA